MKYFKLIFILALSLLIAIGGYGCMNSNNRGLDFTSFEKKDINTVISYLEDKYGCGFVYKSSYGATMGSNTSYIIVTCDNLADKDILVCCVTNDDGTVTIYDNYMAHYFEDDTYQRIKTIIDNVFVESMLFYSVENTVLPLSIDKQSTLDDYLNDNGNSISPVVIVQNGNDNKPLAEKLISEMANNNINISVRLYFSDLNECKGINDNNIEKMAGNNYWYHEKVNFAIGSNGNILYEEWK